MNKEKALHFNPPHGLRGVDDNDPQAANSARARIAGLPSQYHVVAMPTKEEVAASFRPVSPAAEAQPLTSDFPDMKSVRESLSQKKPQDDAPVAKAAERNPLEVAQEPIQEQSGPSKTVVANKTTLREKSPASRVKRKLPSQVRPLLTALITFAVLFSVFKSPIIFSQLEYFTKKPAPAPAAPAVVTVPSDPVIDIPKINVHAPVVYISSNAETAVQKGLESGVVHYAGTALPGQRGNTVIVGHSSNDWWEPGSYKFVFVLLDKLVVGDTFSINYNSKKYVYEVTESKVVEPTDLSVLKPTAEPTVTLITCTPPGTAWKRLIIHAKQTSPTAETAAKNSDGFQPAGDLPGDSKGLSNTLNGIWESIVNLFTDEQPDSEAPTGLPGT